jgi:hypothetical protein
MWTSSPGLISFFPNSSTVSAGGFEYSASVRGLNLSSASDASVTIPQLFISGGTAQWMSFGASSTGAPTLINSPNRSAGTKIVLWQSTGAALDNALGITSSGGTLWMSSVGSISFYTNNSTTVRATIDSSGLTLAASCSVVMATTGTGGMIGTSTSQLVGFHGTAGTIQRASAAQAAVATTAATLTAPYGYTTAAQADCIVSLLNEIRTVLVNKGLMKGSA